MITPEECGCRKKIVDPDAPYRVVGYNDWSEEYDIPFYSIVSAIKMFHEMERRCDLAFFVNKLTINGKPSRVEIRLNELAMCLY
jgi:hypothetical protein